MWPARLWFAMFLFACAPATLFATLVGPLYIRLLLTGQRIDDEFIRAVVDVVLNGARPQGQT